jgi:type I restriction enzyme S subunit
MKVGWQTKRLVDVATLQRGFDLPTQDRMSGDIPIVSSSGVIDTHNKGMVRGPGVVTGRSGSIGNVFFIEQDYWPLNTVLYIKDFHGNDPRFVFHLLKKFDLKRFASGTGVPTLNRNFVHDELVNIPPLPEQQRIVAILDEAFAGIAIAKVNAEKNLQNARALFESHLQTVFSEQDDGWVEKRLGDASLLEIIDGDRGTYYPKATDFYNEGHCLFLNTKNVRPDGFNFDSTMFITAEKDRQLRKGKLKRGDVVLTTRGTIGNIGHYSEDVEYDDIRINSGMLIFRTNKHLLLPSFLFELLRSEIVKSQIRTYTTGAAQPHLPIKTLVNFTIPVPKNVEDQRILVTRLRAFEPETQRLESIYQQKLAALDELKKSLLHQAFTGAL